MVGRGRVGRDSKKTNIHYKVSMDNYDLNSAIMGGFPCYGLHFLIIYHSLISQPLLQLGDRHETQVQNFSNIRTMQHFSTQGITSCGGREQNSSLGIYGDSTSLDLTNGDHFPEPHALEIPLWHSAGCKLPHEVRSQFPTAA